MALQPSAAPRRRTRGAPARSARASTASSTCSAPTASPAGPSTAATAPPRWTWTSCARARSCAPSAPTATGRPGEGRGGHRDYGFRAEIDPPLERGLRVHVTAVARAPDGARAELARVGSTARTPDPTTRLLERIYESVTRIPVPAPQPAAPPADAAPLLEAVGRIEVAQARLEAALRPHRRAAAARARARPQAHRVLHAGDRARLTRRRDILALAAVTAGGALSVLFVHNDFPAQFGDLARWLARRGWDVTFATAARDARAEGLRILPYAPHRDPSPAAHPYAQPMERAALHAQAFARAALAAKAEGLRPDVVVAHSGGVPASAPATCSRRRPTSPIANGGTATPARRRLSGGGGPAPARPIPRSSDVRADAQRGP
jgi:hypothetical protein